MVVSVDLYLVSPNNWKANFFSEAKPSLHRITKILACLGLCNKHMYKYVVIATKYRTYSLFSNKHHNKYRRFFKKSLICLWLHKWHNEFWEQGNFCSKFETSSGGHYMIHSIFSLSEKKSSQWIQLFHKYYISNVMETFLQSEWILIIPSQLHSFWSWKTWGKKCQN